MLCTDLKRFADFADLDPDALNSVRRNSRIIELASQRWVTRARRQVRGRYYLLRGRLFVGGGRVLDHREERARYCVLPGATEVRTLTSVLLVHVDWDEIAFLLHGAEGGMVEPEVGWEEIFLDSPMMRRLEPTNWLKALAALEPMHFSRGTVVIREGDRADCCFVLASGEAFVSRTYGVVRRLTVGDFFGEDAPVTGRLRNATVTMQVDGEVMRMPLPAFRKLLLRGAVSVRSQAEGALCLNIGQTAHPRLLNLPLETLRDCMHLLDESERYAIVGGTPRERILGALLLIQGGLEAFAVCQAGTVRPAAQLRRDAMDSACRTDMG